jgi:hypothetical protein
MDAAISSASRFFADFSSGRLNESSTHWWLIVVIVAAEISLGVGILIESPKDKTRWEQFGVGLVLAGCVVSALSTVLLLVFDEGISRAQNTTIIALDKAIAPRRLSSDNITALRDAVVPFRGSPISIWSYGLDTEGRLFAAQIKSVLDIAQIAPIDRIGAMVSSTTPRIGIVISGTDEKLIVALLKALRPFSAKRVSPSSPGSYSQTGADIVFGELNTPVAAEIFVGIKPLPQESVGVE